MLRNKNSRKKESKIYSEEEVNRLINSYCVLENLNKVVIEGDYENVKDFLGIFKSALRDYSSLPRGLKELVGSPLKLDSSIVKRVLED